MARWLLTWGTGQWEYTLDNTNAAVQMLAEGQMLTDTFTFEAGSADPITVTITINGANDAPVLGTAIVNQTGQTNHAIDPIDLSGLFTDVDAGDTLTLMLTVTFSDGATITNEPVSVTMSGGSSTMNFDGFVYTIADKEISGTPARVGTYTIEVIATDGSGDASEPSTFTINVTADNPPVITHVDSTGAPLVGQDPATGSVTEDDNVNTATGFLKVIDADTGDEVPDIDPLSNGGVGTYGTMTFMTDEDGIVTWTYTLDNTKTQALKEGVTDTDTFTFNAGGSEGAEPIMVVITVTGANEIPEVSGNPVITEHVGKVGQEIEKISEADLLGFFDDPDADDSLLTLSMVRFLDATGASVVNIGLVYTPDDGITGTIPESANAGTYKIEVTVTDEDSGTSVHTFNIVVTHPPKINNSNTNLVIGEDEASIMGTLSITDADTDSGDQQMPTIMPPDDLVGTYGTLTFAQDGTWVYTLNNNAQALNGDQTETETFIFTAEGADDFELVITVNGANDAPVLGTAIVNQTGQTNHAITPIDLSGLFTDVDAGDTLTLMLTVTFSDGATITNEPVSVTTSGNSLTMNFDGFVYTIADKEISGTPARVGTYTIEVIATDGGGSGDASEPSTFTINVTADNPPVITHVDSTGAPLVGQDPATGSVTEDDNVNTATGFLKVIDADTGDEVPDIDPLSNGGVGTYGTMTFMTDEDGIVTWTYTLDNTKTQALKEGVTDTDTFTFNAGGSEGAEPIMVVITVTGANEIPEVSGNPVITEHVGKVGQEIEKISEADLLGFFDDPDADDSLLTLSMVRFLDATGASVVNIGLVYTPDDGITGTIPESANAGTYKIEVTVTDEDGGTSVHTFNIVVTHPPKINNSNTNLVIGEDEASIMGTLSITDADTDSGDQQMPTIMPPDDLVGTYGTLTFAQDGTWVYTLNNNAQALNGDQTETETFIFTAEGADDFELVITVNGANDAPVAGTDIVSQSGTAGQAITAINLGSLFTDVDTGDTFTLTVMVHDGSGRVGLDTLGLTYDPIANAITGTIRSDVSAGTFTIEVIATDGSGDASAPSTFDIVVVADNKPVIGGAVDGTIAEDAADPIMGTLTITDADSDEVPTVALDGNGVGRYGTLTFVASPDGGVWTYTLDNDNPAVQALKGGTLEDNFTFTADGAEDVTVTITISGVNDAPVVVSALDDQTGRVGQEIDAIDLSSLFADVDTGDTLTLTVMVIAASDRLGLNTLGLEYDSDTKMITGTLLNSVIAGPHTIEVIATDGSGAASQPSTFTIVAAPDNAPVIGGAADGMIAEDAANPLTGTLTITDADVGDALPTVMLSDGTGQYGTLTFVASGDGGAWTYTLNNNAQALKGGQTGTETFTFTAVGADDFTLTIMVQGENDAPVVGTDIASQSGTAGRAITSIDLSGLFTDADAGDTLTLTFTVTLNNNSIDNTGLSITSKMLTGTLSESLEAGDYMITVKATDSIGTFATSVFTLTVAEPAVSGGGAPTANPMTGIEIMEDTDYAFPDTPQELIGIVWFC